MLYVHDLDLIEVCCMVERSAYSSGQRLLRALFLTTNAPLQSASLPTSESVQH